MAPDTTHHYKPRIRPAATSPGFSFTDAEAQVDMAALRAYRLGRVRAQLRRRSPTTCRSPRPRTRPWTSP